MYMRALYLFTPCMEFSVHLKHAQNHVSPFWSSVNYKLSNINQYERQLHTRATGCLACLYIHEFLAIDCDTYT